MKQSLVFIILFAITATGWSQKLFPFNKDTLWGVIDENKEIIVSPTYDKVFFYQNYDKGNATAIVKKNDRFGLINRQGEVIIPINNKRIKFNESHPEYLLVTDTDGKKGLFDSSNLKFFIDCAYKNIFFVRNENDFIQVTKEEGQGIITPDKKIIVPIEYNYIVLGEDKNAACPTFIGSKNNRKDRYNCQGDLIGSEKYKSEEEEPIFMDQELDEADYPPPPRPTRKRIEKEKIKEEPQIKALLQEYDHIDFYQNSANELIVTLSKNNKYGFANRQGEIVIPVVYDKLKRTLLKDIYFTIKEEKRGIINLKKKVVVAEAVFDKLFRPSLYNNHQVASSLYYFYAEKDNIGGFLNWETGEYFIPE